MLCTNLCSNVVVRITNGLTGEWEGTQYITWRGHLVLNTISVVSVVEDTLNYLKGLLYVTGRGAINCRAKTMCFTGKGATLLHRDIDIDIDIDLETKCITGR